MIRPMPRRLTRRASGPTTSFFKGGLLELSDRATTLPRGVARGALPIPSGMLMYAPWCPWSGSRLPYDTS